MKKIVWALTIVSIFSFQFSICQAQYNESVVVKGDVSGNEIDVTMTDGAYTFKMPGEAVTITVTFNHPDLVDAALWCEGNSTLYFVRQPTDAISSTWDGQTITSTWYGDAVTNVG